MGEGTDEELRPQADQLIRKLIALGWVQLARRWHDKPAPGQPVFVNILGERHEAATIARDEPIPPEDFDRVLEDQTSWDIGGESEVVLATTAEGDLAVAGGALAEAYAKIYGPKDGPSAERV